ncbi:MAG: DUF397 domain-containing protein [Pseudonocardiaceae bacterium]
MLTAHRRAGWRKSTYSAFQNGCVEVNPSGAGMQIRHSKISDSPVISFTGEQWSRWLDEVVSDHLTNTNGAVAVLVGSGSWTVREASTGTELVFDEPEWTAFRLGAKDGEFSPPAMEPAPIA